MAEQIDLEQVQDREQYLIPRNLREARLAGIIMKSIGGHKRKCPCDLCKLSEWYWATMHVWHCFEVKK